MRRMTLLLGISVSSMDTSGISLDWELNYRVGRMKLSYPIGSYCKRNVFKNVCFSLFLFNISGLSPATFLYATSTLITLFSVFKLII